jgi:hypothetical protein
MFKGQDAEKVNGQRFSPLANPLHRTCESGVFNENSYLAISHRKRELV